MFSNLSQNEILLAFAILFIIFFLGFKLGRFFSRDKENRATKLFGSHSRSPIITFGRDYKTIKKKIVPQKETVEESALIQTKNLKKYQDILG
jgi:hypothetical protein